MHIIAAVAMQLVIGLISGDWFAGACFGSAFYIGREITQAEYRAIEHTYGGFRKNMPWYGGFMPSAWTLKSLLDWIFPTIAVFFIAAVWNEWLTFGLDVFYAGVVGWNSYQIVKSTKD